MKNKEILPVKQGQKSHGGGISQVICVRINNQLLQKVEDLAQQNSVTRSSVIIHALKKITN
tara:strand:+ start:1815 stop:1997 length:183 start_codon:yes stop_codon:yes gene_type:complete